MTPKEKAKNLVDKFSEYAHTDFVYIRGGYQAESQLQNAKQCALISVYEIIDSYIQEKNNGYIVSEKIIPYWQEVKQEIENL
jgi:hypothetical protein